MSKSTIYIIILVLVLALYFYYDQYQQSSVSPLLDKEVEISLETEPSDESVLLSTIPDGQTTEGNSSSFEDTNTILKHYERCGTDRERFIQGSMSRDQTNLSDEQKFQFERFKDKCFDWFSYYELLHNQEKKYIEQLNDQYDEQYFSIFSYEPSEQIKEQARKAVLNTDSPELTEVALLYLLHNDFDFIAKVGEQLGAGNTAFITSNSMHIAALYGCELGKDCSKDGWFMTDLCLSKAHMCNHSYYSHLDELFTDNIYSELFLTLDAVKQVLNSEWLLNLNTYQRD